MQSSVLKLKDTKRVQIWQLLITCSCGFAVFFSRQAFSSKAAPQRAAQIKDQFVNLTESYHMTYEKTQKVSCLEDSKQ